MRAKVELEYEIADEDFPDIAEMFNMTSDWGYLRKLPTNRWFLRCYEDKDENRYFDDDDFVAGAALYVKNGDVPCWGYTYRPSRLFCDGKFDGSEVDAFIADWIVQYAAYGELVYG